MLYPKIHLPLFPAAFPAEEMIRAAGCPFRFRSRSEQSLWIAITILDYARFAPKLYELTGMKEEIERLGIKTYEESGKYSDAIIWKMEEAFRKKTSEEWLELLTKADIVCGLVNHFSDVIKSEQAWANNYLQKYTCRNGSVLAEERVDIRFGKGYNNNCIFVSW